MVRSTSEATCLCLCGADVVRSAEADVPDRGTLARRVGALGDLVRGVALDRVDAAVCADGLDYADVFVPDDQVTGLGLNFATRVRDRLAGLLGPGVHVVDAAEALSVVAQRHARLARGPRGEVRAPWADAGAGRGL